jgi:ubiquinone/menaquinone biosynthesis C-methylase UbiE
LVNEELARLRRGDVDRVFAIAARLVDAVAVEGASILDAACASGFYSEVLATCVKAKLNYTGIDLSPSMINLARESYPHLNFQVASLTALPFPDRAFDIAFSSGAIVHVPDYRQAIREVARVARAHVVSHRMWVYPDGTPTRKFVERLYDIPYCGWCCPSPSCWGSSVLCISMSYKATCAWTHSLMHEGPTPVS